MNNGIENSFVKNFVRKKTILATGREISYKYNVIFNLKTFGTHKNFKKVHFALFTVVKVAE